MARAKRTSRAEARRRYRAQLAAEGVEEGLDDAPDEGAAADRPEPSRAASRPPAPRADAPPPAPQPRPGIGYAFRAAFRPANFREDLALLPKLIRHRSVWIPALISIGTTAALLVTGGSDFISYFLYQYFVVTPPIGAIFLAGFLAPRASYLTGAIAGFVGAACLAVLVAASVNGVLAPGGTPGASPSASAASSPAASVSPGPSASAPARASAPPSASAPASAAPGGSPGATTPPSPAPSGTGTPSPATPADAVGISFILSTLTGAFFGAAAAWYKRFLNLANPNRGARRPPPSKGKPRRR